MLSTSSKIAIGYILLIGLLIGSVMYIYQQMNVLSGRTELETLMNNRRKMTHKIISQLYEMEITGQTLQMIKNSEYQSFRKKMNEVQLSIDTLQTLLTDSMQCQRLDTLRALLRYKNSNIKAVTKALKRIPTEQIYQQQFDSLLTQQDSLLNSSHIRRRVITHHNTYTIHHKPKGFFKRIADVFAPGQADSTNVNNVIQEEVIDTLEEAYNPIDTIASMLTDIQSKVVETREKELRTLNAHINRLRMNGSDLSRRVNQLLETIEREEQEAAIRKINQEQEIRNHAAWTMASITILAIVLSIAFFTVIWNDLTRSNHYRKELEKSKRYAEDLLVAREKLMLTITHDIKAPAGSIIGYIDLLMRLINDKRQLFYLNNMQSAAQHLLNLVTSLLDFHRLEAGKMDLSPVSFKPYQLLEDIYHCFLPLAKKKDIQIFFKPEMNANLTLEGDPFRLRQIVENLLSNALKFTAQGSITVLSSYQGNQLCIRISDTGCGMTTEEQSRIFTEFTRLNSAQGQEGFGLGLSITRKLVDLQNGKIRVDSIPNVGSTFEISIPLPSFGNKVTNTHVESSTAAETPLDVNFKTRFLIIDDDRIQMQLTAALMQRAMTNVPEICCCERPEEVLEKLQKTKYDVIFTDIQMPALNGFELLKAIRNLPQEENQQVPVVAITARGDMNKQEFKEKGFAGMLQKPFNQSDLQQVLSEVLKLDTSASDKEATLKTETAETITANNQHHSIEQEGSETSAPQTDNINEIHINWAPLLDFAEGDEEASMEILNTLKQETAKNSQIMQKAWTNKDQKGLGEIAHKMLPTFTLLETGKAVNALQWLENKRNGEINWQEVPPKVKCVLAYAEAIIQAEQP